MDGPAVLTVRHRGGILKVPLPSGQSVREALDTTEVRVRAACGGTGACGACTVRLLEGQANPPTAAEYLKLLPEDRESGLRLACQLRPEGEAVVELDDPAPPSSWRSIPPENLAPSPPGRSDIDGPIYGIAVDLGTTHIRLAFWDRKNGRRIATRRGPNPQGIFGADVLNRLEAAHARPERAAEIAALARNAIVQAVRDILARDLGEVTPMLAKIGRVAIVGNTAMLALLTGQGGGDLMNPANWESPIDCGPSDEAVWGAQWFMPAAEFRLLPPLAGFVGSDLLADLLATDLIDGPAGSMLLDLGTNTEIALWDGKRLHVTSVPGGPAFEAVGIRHGMAAEPGAIFRVEDDGSYQVIGGGPAKGFCGSGLADGIAVLLAWGILKPSGRFAASPGPEGHALDPANPRTAITGRDVDAFQRAKAANAAAMEELLRQAGLDWSGLTRLCVCGAFGRHLDVGHAQAVGLLPPMADERVELHADAALAGCERLLLQKDWNDLSPKLTGFVKTFNLSLVAGYEDRFIAHLRLASISLPS